MNKKQLSNKLANQLSHLSEDQINNLITQAKKLKKRSRTKEGSLDTWIQRILQKNQRKLDSATDIRTATVAGVHSHELLLQLSNEQVLVSNGYLQTVVGDKVKVGMIDQELTILELLDRKTKLSRPEVNSGRSEQLIVANVDIVVIVVSIGTPPLHPRLIDRYLIAIQNGGAQPALCINKIDLLVDNSELDAITPYESLDMPVFKCSVAKGIGINAINEEFANKTIVFVGHSGVGKSSLANAINPKLKLLTGDLSEGYGRGTHTTTSSSLHRLDNGMTIIDTPGIRSFGLWETGSDEITASFTEFHQFSCKFRDCTHRHEPGCGVIEAVEEGFISDVRYKTYLRMMEEL